MATKNNLGEYDCYAHAEPDEPMFILRANDPLAPHIVRLWALLRRGISHGHEFNTAVNYAAERGKQKGKANPEKIAEAKKCATDMIDWHQQKNPERKLMFVEREGGRYPDNR